MQVMMKQLPYLAAILLAWPFGTRSSRACAQTELPCSPASHVQAGDKTTVEMKNGDIVQGVLTSSDANSVTLDSVNFGTLRIALANVIRIGPCASTPAVSPGTIAAPQAPSKASPPASLHGLEQLTVSMGFTGSAQRDESYSASPTLYAFERELDARTLLSLSASYDDKWKAAPNTSNITQVFSGKLQQLLLLHAPVALGFSGNAYRNNSQGIIIDQAYAIGGVKTFNFKANANVESDFDIRFIHDEMHTPGPTVSLVGSNLSLSYSKLFPPHGSCPQCLTPRYTSVVFKAGVIPVFNRPNSWQAYGTFDAFHQVTNTWSVGLQGVDNYFEIAPKGFNKNYIKLGIALKYSPATNKTN